MIFLKACPRCRGDVSLDRDIYGRYMRCLQCGTIKDLVEDSPSRAGSVWADQDARAA